MRLLFQRLTRFSREHKILSLFHSGIHRSHFFPIAPNQSIAQDFAFTSLHPFHDCTKSRRFYQSSSESTETGDQNEDETALWIQNVMKFRRDKTTEEIHRALDHCQVALTEALLLNVLRRLRSDWKSALTFFNWASDETREHGFSPGTKPHNEILDILGKTQRFEEQRQVLDKMSLKEDLVNETTYLTLVHRFTAAHRIDDAIAVFRRRCDLGLKPDSGSFRTLLTWMCRYKHVEDAETLFRSAPEEFRSNIKTWNVVLNGWCVRGNIYEAKRFWRDIIASDCRPDLFTFGTYINALTSKGKIGAATKLFRSMWDNRWYPDTPICNTIVNALCFKKRIPEALEVVRVMKEKGLEPNTATYNTLIKYMCKIRRMEKVYEIVGEMEENRGGVSVNHVTYGFLLKALKKPEEIPDLLVRMERNGVGMTGDTYNLILKLYVDWDCEERVRETWNEIERTGYGPDQRAYTIMIHGLHEKGRTRDASRYFAEMKSKGMKPEPRTEILMNSDNSNTAMRKTPEIESNDTSEVRGLAGS